MEGILGWVVIFGFGILWAVIKSAWNNKKVENKIKSIPELTVNIKVEEIKEIKCFVIYAKGWVNSKRGHTVSGKMTLSLIDKTDETGAILLTSVDGFGEIDYPHIFGQEREMDFGPDTYFPEFVKLFVIPIDVLAFPYKGHRTIEAKVIYGTRDLQVSLGGVVNVKSVIGFATDNLEFSVESIGYKEFEKNTIDFEESAISLAMFTASIDGSLDQVELDVIKSWYQKRAYFIEDENEADQKKKTLTNFIQRTFKQAKEKKLTMSQIMSKIKKDLSIDQRYKVVELMLDVMAADSVLDEKENDLIERTVKSLDLDYKTFKAMLDVRLSKLTKIDVAEGDDQKLFGLNDDMTNDQKCKELRKQYSKWSGLTTSSDKLKREQANKMVEKIAKLRQSFNC